MKNILLVFVLGLAIFSCDKDEPETDQGTPLERLTGTGAKKWKLSFAEARAAGDVKVNLMTYQCWADNELTLNSNGTYTLEDSGVKCSYNTNVSSVWAYSDNPAQIKLGSLKLALFTLDNLTLDVKELTSSKFSGIAKNVSLDNLTAQEVELTFQEVK